MAASETHSGPDATNPEADCPQKAVVRVNPVCHSPAVLVAFKDSNEYYWPKAFRTVPPVILKIIDALIVYRKNHSLLFHLLR